MLSKFDLCSGHYVPQLSQAIVRHNIAAKDSTINLKGFMVCMYVAICY